MRDRVIAGAVDDIGNLWEYGETEVCHRVLFERHRSSYINALHNCPKRSAATPVAERFPQSISPGLSLRDYGRPYRTSDSNGVAIAVGGEHSQTRQERR